MAIQHCYKQQVRIGGIRSEMYQKFLLGDIRPICASFRFSISDGVFHTNLTPNVLHEKIAARRKRLSARQVTFGLNTWDAPCWILECEIIVPSFFSEREQIREGVHFIYSHIIYKQHKLYMTIPQGAWKYIVTLWRLRINSELKIGTQQQAYLHSMAGACIW